MNSRTVLIAALAMLCGCVASAQEMPTVEITGPTVVAFFAPMTDAEMEKDPAANEALSDFQFYTGTVREPLKNMGVRFEELYVKQFRVREGKNVVLFRPHKIDVGYYLVAPGKKPRIEYGVMTEADLIDTAREYFGLPKHRGK